MSLRSFAIAAGIVVGVTLPADAAYTTRQVHVRAGPGTWYAVLFTAHPGAPVRVRTCVPGWCQVNYSGVIGWMASAYIAGGPGYPQPHYPRYVVKPQPYVVQPAPLYAYPQPFVYAQPYGYAQPYAYTQLYVVPRAYAPRYPHARPYGGPSYSFSFSYGRPW